MSPRSKVCATSGAARRAVRATSNVAGRLAAARYAAAEQLTSEEFLRPAGFSVDPRVRAHADTDTLSYVPPEDPVVSTRDTTWQSLPVPELGRYRCSREGLVRGPSSSRSVQNSIATLPRMASAHRTTLSFTPATARAD